MFPRSYRTFILTRSWCRPVTVVVWWAALALGVLAVSPAAAAPGAAVQDTRLISASSHGLAANDGVSIRAATSAHGRYTAFVSTASNLTGRKVPGALEVYRHDQLTGATVLVSTAPGGLCPCTFRQTSSSAI